MVRCLIVKIGVFDSGKGGEAVADELRQLLPHAEVIFIDDRDHVPYGGRSRHEVITLTRAAIQPLLAADCDAIVVACNTATTNAIQVLRAENPHQKFVGIEPMIKPAAALTKTKKIAVLATPATLKSARYAALKEEWTAGITVFEPDCTDWAALIEARRTAEIPLEQTIGPLLAEGVDVVVLGCTHFHWLKASIEAMAGPEVTVLEPSQAIKNRLVDITR